MKQKWKHIVAGAIAIGILYPVTAHADQGVMLKPYEVKDETGNILQSYEKGQRLQMIGESEDSYIVSNNHNRYSIEKQAVLKTHDEEETSITIKEEQTNLHLLPSLFSHSIQQLGKGEKVQRAKDAILNDEYWLQVETVSGLTGSVYRDEVEINYKATETTTKAFVVQEINKDGKAFDYGQEIFLSDFREGSFIVKEGDKEYMIPESHISFTKPSKPFVLTASYSFPEQLKIYGNPQYVQPVNIKHPRVSSRYGQRWGRLHGGTDVAIPIGTPLYAVADGVVTRSVKNQTHSKLSWGNYVKINHGSEDTLYGHMNKVIVNSGEHVKQGQLIGYSGNSGNSTGPHLHFELYKSDVRVDSHFIVNQPELYR